MFKLLITLALVGLTVGASNTPDEKEARAEIEHAIFYQSKPMEPEEMLVLVETLTQIHKLDQEADTAADKWLRKWTEVLHKIGHPTESNCADLSYFDDFAHECKQYSQMRISTSSFVKSFKQKQEELCNDEPKSVRSSRKKPDRKSQLEAAIFYTGKPFGAEEMEGMVDELSQIYANTEELGTPEDSYMRKWTAVLLKMSHPSKVNCADMSYFEEFAHECRQNSYLKESTATFYQAAKQEQDKFC